MEGKCYHSLDGATAPGRLFLVGELNQSVPEARYTTKQFGGAGRERHFTGLVTFTPNFRAGPGQT